MGLVICTLLPKAYQTNLVAFLSQYCMALLWVLRCALGLVVALEPLASVGYSQQNLQKGTAPPQGEKGQGRPNALDCCVEQHLNTVAIIKLAHTVNGGSVKLEGTQ